MLKAGLGITAVPAAALLCMATHSAASEASYPLVSMTNPTGGVRNGLDVATVDVTGIQSMDAIGSPLNHVMVIWIGPFNRVTGIGWDVVLETIAPKSWRDDISMLVTNSLNQTGFFLHPGAGDGPGGPTSYSSGGEILKLNPTFEARAGADGLIRLEFFEIIDDAPGQIDGQWIDGSIHLQTADPIGNPVSPGAASLFGIASLCFSRRKRAVL